MTKKRPRPSSSSSFFFAALKLGAALALTLTVIAVFGAAWSSVHHVTWRELSAGPDAPAFHDHLRHLRGAHPLARVADALRGDGPLSCDHTQQTPAPLHTLARLRGCAFDADGLAQRHPHYTIERVAYTADGNAWVVRLVPRRGDIPLNARSLALFGLPDVPLVHEVAPDDAHRLEWDGTAHSPCASDSAPCAPSLIRVYGTATAPHRVMMVKLLFVRANAVGEDAPRLDALVAQAPMAQHDPSRPALGVEPASSHGGASRSAPGPDRPGWYVALALSADLPSNGHRRPRREA